MEDHGGDNRGKGLKEGKEGEEEEEVMGSSLTMERVAAAKQFIESHYKAQRKLFYERKQRSFLFPIFSMIQFDPLILLLQNFESFHGWG